MGKTFDLGDFRALQARAGTASSSDDSAAIKEHLLQLAQSEQPGALLRTLEEAWPGALDGATAAKTDAEAVFHELTDAYLLLMRRLGIDTFSSFSFSSYADDRVIVIDGRVYELDAPHDDGEATNALYALDVLAGELGLEQDVRLGGWKKASPPTAAPLPCLTKAYDPNDGKETAMTETFVTDCSPLLESQRLEAMLPGLDEARRRQLERLPQPEKKAQCAAAGWLLTTLLGQDGRPPALSHGSRGKPYLAGRQDMFFNLSHTGRWVFCAVSDREVGLDAQTLGPHNPRVAERYFTPREQEWVAEDPQARFTRLWALKEAYLKFTGFGLVLPMNSFTVPLPAGGWDDSNACQWWEGLWTAAEDTVCVAVCAGSREPIRAPRLLSLPDIK